LGLGFGRVAEAALAGQVGGDGVRLAITDGDIAGKVANEERRDAGDDDALGLFAFGRHVAGQAVQTAQGATGAEGYKQDEKGQKQQAAA